METPSKRRLERVAVMGIPGSGKSTFAQQLGEALDAPVFHLDTIYWRRREPANWEDFRAEQRQLLVLDRWVLDGNYSNPSVLQERLARADAIVVMDVGRWTAMGRIVRRFLRNRARPSAHGNPGMSWQFLCWVWRWEYNHPDFAESLRRQLGGRPVFVVRCRRDQEKLLTEIRQQHSGASLAA